MDCAHKQTRMESIHTFLAVSAGSPTWGGEPVSGVERRSVDRGWEGSGEPRSWWPGSLARSVGDDGVPARGGEPRPVRGGGGQP